MKSKKSRVRDFDPESLLDPAPSSSSGESDIESEEDANTGREHYESVGKSKLRKPATATLGPQYEGSRISRHDAADDDSDDPFARNFDSEADSDSDASNVDVNGAEDSDEEHTDGETDDSEEQDDSERDEGDLTDATEDSTENSGDEDGANGTADSAAEIRKMMAKEQTAVAATISHAAKTDIDKGKAVKAQRKIFDALLNTRIRLQKTLIASNSIAADQDNHITDEPAIQAAETAALSLLNNLTDLQHTLDATRTGQKRKSSVAFSAETPSSEIWDTIRKIETSNHSHRTSVLEKWSTRTRATPVLGSSRNRLNNVAQQTLSDVLQNHLRDSSRLVKRTRVPRSCAPIQSSAGVPESEHIYDDADFYGLLLKELLEQRSQDLSANGLGNDMVIQAPWQAAREVKSKKIVDTKASKGRKLRYTVHEKLQNFMAPEERGTWGERQRDELFGSLFGRKAGLGEDVVSDEEVLSDADNEDGLMLFKS